MAVVVVERDLLYVLDGSIYSFTLPPIEPIGIARTKTARQAAPAAAHANARIDGPRAADASLLACMIR